MDAATIAAIASVIAAIGAPVAMVCIALVQLRPIKQVVQDIHENVQTMNAGTVGSFAAEDETRRIEAIPHNKRTPTEQHHLDVAPEKEPPQGPSR